MKIAFNPSTVAALIAPPNNKDITFDLRGQNIFARGVKFCGTDTNTWRDIKINNVSIGSNILDLRNGSNTTLTNTNGVVTINSTWRPVVDNLTSDSTTSSLSAKQGKILKSLIDGKSNSGHTHDDRYLKLTGGTMTGNALITFADSGSWSTDKGPQGARGGLYWTGQSNYAKLYAEETVGDNLDLVIQLGDDNSNGLSIRNKANTQTSYISAGGVITTGTFKGNLDWSYITNKPSSYTPSAHTHAWSSLTHSSTTENQAILTNGKANGWKLYTLNISRWDNAANNAHSHANKSVLDGITSGLVNNWNIAYTFVNTITGTDTDKVINKWDEIVNFLAGITEDNKLNTLLNSKLSVYELANNTNVGAIKNNGIYYSTTDASSRTLTNSPFNTGFALINMTSDDGGDDLRRSRLAFNAYGEVKVSDDRDQANTAETWYNILTSKNSGISGSTIKLNGTSITVYSSSTADSRYVKKSGDTMTGALNFANATWNLVGDDSYMGDYNISGHFGIKAANTTYPGIAFFNNANAHLGNLTAYNGNIKYRAYSLQFLDNGNTSVSAGTWMNPFSTYNASAIANEQAICVWGQSSYLSNLASDSGDMSLWLKRVNANIATLNMVLDGEYYANGNQRLAHVSEIPNSLKNPYSLTTFGVVYDGSAAKTVTTSTFISQVTECSATVTDGTMFITSYASNSGFADTNAVNVPYKRKAIHLWKYIKAKTDSLYAVIGHNHDGRYVRYYTVTTLDCNNLAVGLTAAKVSATNAAHTNYSAFLYISDVGTPFQIQIPDSSVPYIYKRYYSSGTWSGWFKLNAGYADSAGSVAWDNVTGKPSSFTPSAHTHTVFKNNLMIKGTNGVSDSASIHLGIGDSDTGFKWISDGKCQIYADNAAVGEWTSGGMNWFRNPTVNGNKIWNAGNDGSGSGLDADTVDGVHMDWSTNYTAGNYLAIWDNAGNCIRPIPKGSASVGYAASAGNADTVDGYHATDGRTFTGNINWSPNWNDAWNDGTNNHPWYGFDHRYSNTGAYSTTITDYYGMTIKTANTLRLDFGTLLLNSGNVGIGTTTPTQKLDVNGQMKASGFHHASVNSDNYMLLAGGGCTSLKNLIFTDKSYTYTDHSKYNLIFHKLSGICNNLVWVDGYVYGSVNSSFMIDINVRPYCYDNDYGMDSIYVMSPDNFINVDALGFVTVIVRSEDRYRIGFFYTGKA